MQRPAIFIDRDGVIAESRSHFGTPLPPVSVDDVLIPVSDRLPIDATYSCLHDGDTCSCRKPRPGLLLNTIRDRFIDVRRSWMIGDRGVDVAAGRSAGVRTVLLARPYGWSPTSQGSPPSDLQPDVVSTDLRGCVTAIIGSTRLTTWSTS